jgi:DNA gyrase/topoisomerase IV subunit A
MEIFIGIVVGLFAIAGIIFLIRANRRKEKTDNDEKVSTPASGCCGAHEVCDFDEIKADVTRIEYYDDEELDEFKNIKENEYTNNQIEQFREVLYTLKTTEIRYWLLSIERRNINLPAILVSEARLLMAEG